jgi:hypothetical protein
MEHIRPDGLEWAALRGGTFGASAMRWRTCFISQLKIFQNELSCQNPLFRLMLVMLLALGCHGSRAARALPVLSRRPLTQALFLQNWAAARAGPGVLQHVAGAIYVKMP